jgi:hypothetical protein
MRLETLLIHTGSLDGDVLGSHVEQGQGSRLVGRGVDDDAPGLRRPATHPIRPLPGESPAGSDRIGAFDRLEHVHLGAVQRHDNRQVGP